MKNRGREAGLRRAVAHGNTDTEHIDGCVPRLLWIQPHIRVRLLVLHCPETNNDLSASHLKQKAKLFNILHVR